MLFFRKCTGCGRRFHVELVARQKERRVGSKAARTPAKFERPGGLLSSALVRLEKSETVIINANQYRYVYRCKRCGHQWSELRVEKHVEYTGPTSPTSPENVR